VEGHWLFSTEESSEELIATPWSPSWTIIHTRLLVLFMRTGVAYENY